ncbi:hypothetical protein [Arthrobacter gengyunqii]|uniref:hypothetical protein n=1 Tax=Arthrobacter gengyunqii TaxID=2886940 RepID=UPI00311AAE59
MDFPPSLRMLVAVKGHAVLRSHRRRSAEGKPLGVVNSLDRGQPLTMTLVSAAVPPEARGAALALRLLGNRVGQVLLPAAAGLAAAPLGPSGAVWTACLVMAVSAAVKAPAARRDGTAES